MLSQPHANYYCAAMPYPIYTSTGAFYSQTPSPSSSTSSQYSESPSPQDYSFPVGSIPAYYTVPPAYQPYPVQSQTIQQPPPPLTSIAALPAAGHASKISRPRPTKQSREIQIPHPYARLFAKKDEVKRRKIWNHALEKSIFTPYELSTIGAPQRRTLYIPSLEAHIDRLHTQLLQLDFWPVDFAELEPFKGLNSKTAKSMVAGLQHDASVSKLKLLELERANGDLKRALENFPSEN
ncbi:hypothetical protein NLJ89_g9674 [Agrocybe chaxingu]|uniref:Uncharacterized protein n=1 Tax=Agrocybe chaxingu TaxID=84603 RepID=A0A9W8JSK7_9AGAR|nr:hypothetical protein NLJ89_g9674 [Agrocybe chaxingu]